MNKHVKKIIITIIATIILVIFTGCVASRNENGNLNGTEETSKTEKQNKLSPAGKMTDEIAVQIGAYLWYTPWLLANDYAAYQQLSNDLESGRLHQQLGVTVAEYNTYIEQNYPGDDIGILQEKTLKAAIEKWGEEKITIGQ